MINFVKNIMDKLIKDDVVVNKPKHYIGLDGKITVGDTIYRNNKPYTFIGKIPRELEYLLSPDNNIIYMVDGKIKTLGPN